MHADGRFLARIEGGWLRENVQAYGVFFETVSRTIQRFFGQVDEQIAVYFRGSERLALENALDLGVGRFQLKDHLYTDDTAGDLLRLFGPEMEQVLVVLETDVFFDLPAGLEFHV